MRSRIVIASTGLSALLLAGCVEVSVDRPAAPPAPRPNAGAPAELAVFGRGYPNAGDPCRRAGESAFTGRFLDDAADLVACPPGVDPGLFAFSTGARQVARRDGWYLFSVPRR